MSGDQLNPNELEQLLSQAGAPPPAAPAAVPPSGIAPDTSAAGLGQTEIEALLKATGAPVPAAPKPAAAPRATTASDDLGMASGDVEYLLKQAEMALASVNEPVTPGPDLPIQPFELPDFASAPPSGESATLALIRDVELDVKIELGRTQMYLDDLLKLHKGSVVALDKLAGDPVDIYVNGRLIARGEVLVLNDNFCVRVAELIAGETLS